MEGGAPAGERRRRGHHGEQADHLHRRAAGQLPGEPGCPGPRSGAPRPLPSFPVACRGLPKASSRGSNLASALRSTRDLGPVTSPSEPQFPHPRNESAFQLEDSSVLCSFLSLSHSDYLLLAASRTRTPPPPSHSSQRPPWRGDGVITRRLEEGPLHPPKSGKQPMSLILCKAEMSRVGSEVH